ncbi:MAG: ABC transporter ATP-binding protein/permease [Lachnospiraceae bacterium]|nr:ABC transporter ATP-binding protein/permease [Lachnospiraceae bacterium]
MGEVFRTLGAEIKEYKFASVMTPISMVLEVIMEMIIPYLMASIIDKGVTPGDTAHIRSTGGIMVIIAILGLLSGLVGAHFGAYASAGLAKNLRNRMFEKIQTYSFPNLDKYSTAGLVTRLTTDVTNVQNAYQMILRMFMRAPSSIVIAMVMAFSINARLSTIYLVAVIFLALFVFGLMRKVTKYFAEVFTKYDDLNESVQENVSGIRVVKAFVREDYEKDKFFKATENIYRMFVKAERMVILNMPVMQFTVYSCVLLLSWFGAHMIVYGSLTTGELMSLLAYCMNILMSLMMLSFIFVMVSMSSASAKRITEVINETPVITNPENPVFEVADGSIVFDNVSFSYYGEKGGNVLENICLDIKSGETIGIIGGTGSSKTSLINLISRLYDVGSGSVRVGGRDVREYDLTALRNNVSHVLQKNVLFAGSILDNLRWGKADATIDECREACALACADEFIEKFPQKYDTMIEQGGSNLSGGQRQRLCIARALLKKPKILILDDSTSAVDTATDAKIRSGFREAIPGVTKLIIAQRISSVMDADRIIVLDEGRISGFGNHEELMAVNEIYRDVYESQQSGAGLKDFDD